MAAQQPMENIQDRQKFTNFWHTDLLTTIQSDTPYFCFALWCAPCVSYLLRKRALHDDMSGYTCCAGSMPCSGSCGESKCPELCLATEAFKLCLQQLACIFSIIALIVRNSRLQETSQVVPQVISCLADSVYCMACPCMQTQHKIEMDWQERQTEMVAPSVQQMSRSD